MLYLEVTVLPCYVLLLIEMFLLPMQLSIVVSDEFRCT